MVFININSHFSHVTPILHGLSQEDFQIHKIRTFLAGWGSVLPNFCELTKIYFALLIPTAAPTLLNLAFLSAERSLDVTGHFLHS